MDKQINTLSNTAAILPVNTRTIGTPEGIYIVYIEDYVHTFMKKVLSNKLSIENVEGNRPDIALYGKYIEENGQYKIVVSGAALLQESTDKIQKYNDTYFPSCTYIGSACVSRNKDAGLRLELTLRSTKVILDDYYIYYDQNEEMQNYLVEWNNIPTTKVEHETPIRKNIDDAARLGRIAQAYNREEAKVSFMWNVMNILCLGFVVCAMAYGIIFINNYSKMQNMQANIDYCMTFIAENSTLTLPEVQTANINEVSTMQQNIQLENQKAGSNIEVPNTQDEQTKDIQSQGLQPKDEQLDDFYSQDVQPESVQSEDVQTETAQTENMQPDDAAQALAIPQPDTIQPQYYTVRPGDTLRTICYAIYGDYTHVDEICELNNIEEPDNILYGQKLLLPSK